LGNPWHANKTPYFQPYNMAEKEAQFIGISTENPETDG